MARFALQILFGTTNSEQCVNAVLPMQVLLTIYHVCTSKCIDEAHTRHLLCLIPDSVTVSFRANYLHASICSVAI